jgi:hypothetical protein
LRHFLGTLEARELQDGSACQLRLLQVVGAALFELGRHLLRDFAFLVGQLLRLAGVVRMPLVAGDEFLFVDLDGLVLPVCAFDRDFELEGACLLFGVVLGLALVGFVVSRCILGRLFGVVLGIGLVGGLAFFLGVGRGVIDKEGGQVVNGAGAGVGLSVFHVSLLSV